MMILWVILALLTAAIIIALTRPLAGLPPRGGDESHADIALYKSQLQEIQADLERGIISEPEARAASLEISRRLLKIAGSKRSVHDLASSPVKLNAIFATVAAMITATGLSIYLLTGSPHLPAQPLQARLDAPLDPRDIGAMVAKVEARLRQSPEDGNGWNVIAPVYMRLQRFADAAEAYRQAILILGESPERLSGFGEATTLANNGTVTPAAKAAFEKALSMRDDLVMARFWLAAAAEEAGDLIAARDAYGKLLSLPLQTDWRRGVEEKLAAIDAKLKGAVAAQAPVPPDQQALIENMVERLAARLEQDGGELTDWLRLVRAYSVLGRGSEAAAALGKARGIFASDAAAIRQLDDFAVSLGIKS